MFVSSVAHSVSSSASPDYQDHCQLSSMISHAILVTDTINNNDTATDTINNIVWASTMDSLYKSRITASFRYNEITLPPDSLLFCLACY